MVEWQDTPWITNALVGAGGGAAVAFGLFKFLGSKWLESKFAKKLQEHKHAQEKELQRLRIEIDSMLSGVLKLQEREFQVLPSLWEKIHEAYGNTNWFISPLQSYTDLTPLSPQELNDFLNSSWLKEGQRQKILSGTDKNKEYQELFFWHQSSLSFQSIKELQSYTDRNGIFFPDMIFEKTTELYKCLISLSTTHESDHGRRRDPEERETFRKDKENMNNLYIELKQLISNQLRSHTKLKTEPSQ